MSNFLRLLLVIVPCVDSYFLKPETHLPHTSSNLHCLPFKCPFIANVIDDSMCYEVDVMLLVNRKLALISENKSIIPLSDVTSHLKFPCITNVTGT